jgi:hypothetical protein
VDSRRSIVKRETKNVKFICRRQTGNEKQKIIGVLIKGFKEISDNKLYNNNYAIMRYFLILILILGLSSCAEEIPVAPVIDTGPGIWTGQIIVNGYIHSLSKQVKLKKGNIKDSLFLDSNLNDAEYSGLSSLIKIGKTYDSLSNGDKIYWTPQNGFIVFDLAKHFGGTVTNIKTANLKIKLYPNLDYTDSLKFTISILDTTILAKSIQERIEAVQSSTGESASYLGEFTLDIKDKFTSNGKVVVGIKAKDVNQAFASVQYCKIEIESEITRTTTASVNRQVN